MTASDTQSIEQLPDTAPVRLVAAVVSCRQCGFSWQSPLGAWREAVHTTCPQCTARRPLQPSAE